MQTAEAKDKNGERQGLAHQAIPTRRLRGSKRRGLFVFVVLGLGGLLAVATIWIITRERHESALVRQTDRAAIPSVAAITPIRGVQP